MEFKTPFPICWLFFFFFFSAQGVSLLFQDVERDRQHQLCPEKGSISPNSSECFHKLRRKKKLIIYTSPIAPPSLFSILQSAGEKTANKSDFSFSVESNCCTHQYPCKPLYTFCTDPCFNNCLRPARERKSVTAQHKQGDDSAFTHLAQEDNSALTHLLAGPVAPTFQG